MGPGLQAQHPRPRHAATRFQPGLCPSVLFHLSGGWERAWPPLPRNAPTLPVAAGSSRRLLKTRSQPSILIPRIPTLPGALSGLR